MRKVTFLAMALMCGVAFTNCAAKKNVAKQQVAQTQQSDIDRQIDSLKKVRELNKIKKEMELEEAEQDAAIAASKTRARNAQFAQEARLAQKIYTPCIAESYDKHGEYMAGLGIAENQPERGVGIAQANRYALTDITTRFMGVIKNGISQYAKDVNTRNNQKVKESELEGEATSIGQKAIQKHSEIVCRDFELDGHNNYTCYVAVHVPIKEMLDEVVNEQDIITVDADRARFRAFMEKELNEQAAAKEAEKQELQKLKEELK